MEANTPSSNSTSTTGPATVREWVEQKIKELSDPLLGNLTVDREVVVLRQLLGWMNERMERHAKQWEGEIPSLAQAIRSPELIRATEEIQEIGWMKIKTTTPRHGETVLVSNGREMKIARWNVRYGFEELPRNWVTVYWTYLPDAPEDVMEYSK